MNEEERYFTIKEAAKLLGVPTASVKRRIENKKLSVHKRLGKRGLELVIPKRALSLEIMSLIPGSRQLNLSEFETIVIKRFKAMAAGRDQRVSLALNRLCEEFVQLKAEINSFNSGAGDEGAPARALSKDQSSQRREQERARLSLP
ncbi:MAG: helix-turn-helix domain-containing protein [Halobacteriota archaeon]|jgi:excisionase family DNA binding protein